MTSLDERIHAAILGRVALDGTIPGPVDLAEWVRQADPLLGPEAVAQEVARVGARLRGLGPLEPLLADPAVTDVLVNGPGPVWVERSGVLARTDLTLSRSDLDLLIERIVAPLGRRVDPASPLVDARLPDGSRVHVVVPPLAVDGPCLSIRRFAAVPIPLQRLASPPVADLLRWAVRARANIVVSGGTGAGKTTLLGALGAEIPAGERIITVEDAAELRLTHRHVVRLESRPPSPEGTGAVGCRELVRNALRMRPDRVIVGEVRDATALDMVQAMNTGHDGSLSTIHANSADDAVRRLETLVLMADVALPAAVVSEHLAAAVDLIAHVARRRDGERCVVEVAELVEPASRDRSAVAGGGPMVASGVGRSGLTRPLADRHQILGLPTRGGRAVEVADFAGPVGAARPALLGPEAGEAA